MSKSSSGSIHSSDGAESTKSSDIQYPIDIFNEIQVKASQYLSRTDQSVRLERQIFGTISKYLTQFNGLFNVHQYGSTTYGFGGDVDLNIMVDTCKLLLFTCLNSIILDKYPDLFFLQ